MRYNRNFYLKKCKEHIDNPREAERIIKSRLRHKACVKEPDVAWAAFAEVFPEEPENVRIELGDTKGKFDGADESEIRDALEFHRKFKEEMAKEKKNETETVKAMVKNVEEKPKKALVSDNQDEEISEKTEEEKKLDEVLAKEFGMEDVIADKTEEEIPVEPVEGIGETILTTKCEAITAIGTRCVRDAVGGKGKYSQYCPQHGRMRKKKDKNGKTNK